ncbi:MAG: nucleotidyltransferase family protein [Pseudomonadota bacterium]
MIKHDENYIQQALLTFLRDDIAQNALPNLLMIEWEELIVLAKKQHVAEYLYYHLKQNHLLELIPNEQKNMMAESFKKRTFRNLALMAEFHRVVNVLHQHHIPVIALKGLHLVESVYPHIATRFFRDLDVLVPIPHGREAYNCVLNMGYKSDKKLTDLDFSFQYHNHFDQLIHTKNKTVLEIHGYISKDFKNDALLLWENAIASTNKAHHHLTLDLEDLLIHLCVHISHGDLFKIDLRHYLDIYLVLQKYKEAIHWDKVIQRSQDRGCFGGVAIVLTIVEQLFHIDISETFTHNIQNNEKAKQTIKYALEFLWMYDRSSKGYKEYKTKVPLPHHNGSFFKKGLMRLFLNKEELAFNYSLDKNSFKVYFYYPVRFIDLVRKHSKTTLQNQIVQKNKSFIEKTKYVNNYLLNV